MKNRNLIFCLLAVMFFAKQSFCAESDSTRTEKNSEKAKFIIGATGGLSQNNFLTRWRQFVTGASGCYI